MITLKNNITLDIATASTCRATKWQNKRTTWQDIVNTLSQTERTSETIKQYFSYSKDKQGEIKDVGGFVGGYLREGRRKKGYVDYRQIVCLDVDYGTLDLWIDFGLMEYAGCMYTTHKHTPEDPRLRIVFPLSRKVSPDEYEAIARVVASWLGIDAFDDTTYQPTRLMYYPSTSKDGEFIFHYTDGPIMDADEVLAELPAWQDPTTWPVSSRVKDVVKRDGSGKVEDPEDKGGIVGAFCRAYTMDEAIAEFLTEVYEPCEELGHDRYSLVGGSTSGGLVVYDNKLAYSHHATDVAGGKLLNAFDLVRLHKFADLDEKAKPDTEITKLPSYKAMAEFAETCKSVKRLFAEERRERALQDYAELEEAADQIRRKTCQKVLAELLDYVEWVDFHERAELKPKAAVPRNVYQVIVVDEIMKAAVKHDWGLCTKDGFIYAYTGAFWQVTDEEDLKSFLSNAAVKMGVPALDARHFKFKDELYRQFLSSAYLSTPTERQSVLINLANGTFEVSEGGQVLREYKREDFIKYQLSFDYDPDAKCPLFEAYLRRVLPDEDCRKVLAEFMGYVFTKNLKLSKTLILYGSGANGKSVFFNIVNALLGKENISYYPLDTLTRSEYQRAELANRLLNYASEINGKMETDMFKKLVSGEPVDARQIYKRPFDLYDYGKLMFNCNLLPKDTEQTDAFFRRFIIIPFNQRIPESEQDPNLSDKIIAKELSGVFNWVIDGLKRLLAQKGFTVSDSVKSQTENYRKESDSVALFTDDFNYVPSATEYETLQNMYFEYKTYCQDNGYKACSNRTFKDRLNGMGFRGTKRNFGQIIFARKEKDNDTDENKS